MSPSISVSEDTKREWDDLKPEDSTHDDFASYALDCVRRDNGEIVNPSEIADEITRQTAAEVELASYRGVRSAVQELHD